MKRHTASLSATAWRSIQNAPYDPVGGLAVYLFSLLIKLRTTPPRLGGLLGGLVLDSGGLLRVGAPDRQAATRVPGVAR